MSSLSSTDTTKYIHIPAATWSVKDLELDAQHPKLDKLEVQRLSHRALIDITDDENSTSSTDVEQDLANMMHMVQQVSDYTDTVESESLTSLEDDKNGAIYDVVRGVTSAPLRSSPEKDLLQEADQAQATDVWKNYLQPKTTSLGGGHEYFAIRTKEEQ
jgi:hypothetical protein